VVVVEGAVDVVVGGTVVVVVGGWVVVVDGAVEVVVEDDGRAGTARRAEREVQAPAPMAAAPSSRRRAWRRVNSEPDSGATSQPT
jgi:hypothetical protein